MGISSSTSGYLFYKQTDFNPTNNIQTQQKEQNNINADQINNGKDKSNDSQNSWLYLPNNISSMLIQKGINIEYKELLKELDSIQHEEDYQNISKAKGFDVQF